MTRRALPAEDLFGWRPEDAVPEVQRLAGDNQLLDLELIRVPGRDTEFSWCVQKSVLTPPVWLPKSQAELHGGVFTLPRWLAADRRLL